MVGGAVLLCSDGGRCSKKFCFLDLMLHPAFQVFEAKTREREKKKKKTSPFGLALPDSVGW
jgi:hypothetical protein